MTPAERSLLLAVAKHLSETLCEKGEGAGYGLYMDIAAVESQAICPTCSGLGFVLPSAPKQDTTCPTCNGTGKKEKTDDHP